MVASWALLHKLNLALGTHFSLSPSLLPLVPRYNHSSILCCHFFVFGTFVTRLGPMPLATALRQVRCLVLVLSGQAFKCLPMKTRSGREFGQFAMSNIKLLRLDVEVDLASFLQAVDSHNAHSLDLEDDLVTTQAPVASQLSQESYLLTDPDDIPLAKVTFAYSSPPTIKPVYRDTPAVIARSSRYASMTDSAVSRDKAYHQRKLQERRAKAQQSRDGPKLNVDAKLSALWSSCTVVPIRKVDLAKVRMPKTHYTGCHKDVPNILRFNLPLLEQLVAAGFKLIRWNGRLVSCYFHSQVLIR